MNNLIAIDFINKRKQVEETIYTEEDAETWNYAAFYAEERLSGHDKGYDPNNLGVNWKQSI